MELMGGDCIRCRLPTTPFVGGQWVPDHNGYICKLCSLLLGSGAVAARAAAPRKKKRWGYRILLPLIMGVLSCSLSEPLSPIVVDPAGVQINHNNQPEWLLDIAQEAANFWSWRGVVFYITDEGGIFLETSTQENVIGSYAKSPEGTAHIYISPIDHGYSRACLAARHLGFAIGLGSSSEHEDLMGIKLVAPGEECPWTQSDKDHLCRVLGVCDQ
jgi:hypothetical protein